MIIDFRSRPPFDETFDYLTNKQINECYEAFNGIPTALSAQSRSMELYMKELKEAGIDKIVCQGRKGFDDPTMPSAGNNNNYAVRKLMETYPDHVIGIWGIDPADGKKGIDDILENVVHGPFTGVMIEPGLSSDPMGVADKRLFPFYELLEAEHIPLLLAFGDLNYRALRHMDPKDLDDVCEMFDQLHIIAFHGGWPWITETQWIAWNRENFYISPDVFALSSYPGHQMYIDAANHMLQDKIIFASAYPLCDMVESVNYYKKVLRPEVQPKVMGYNALKALGLETPQDANFIDMFWRPSIPEELSNLKKIRGYQW